MLFVYFTHPFQTLGVSRIHLRRLQDVLDQVSDPSSLARRLLELLDQVSDSSSLVQGQVSDSSSLARPLARTYCPIEGFQAARETDRRFPWNYRRPAFTVSVPMSPRLPSIFLSIPASLRSGCPAPSNFFWSLRTRLAFPVQ